MQIVTPESLSAHPERGACVLHPNNQLLQKKNDDAFAQHETRTTFQWSPVGGQRLRLLCF
ncbi:hypothetical protein RRSWK_01699 [Rhodopirellula sp. SWK7]|nr:hypothetical protein RRSWK_01699 [Rhodopirellula sp. SWK7]